MFGLPWAADAQTAKKQQNTAQQVTISERLKARIMRVSPSRQFHVGRDCILSGQAENLHHEKLATFLRLGRLSFREIRIQRDDILVVAGFNVSAGRDDEELRIVPLAIDHPLDQRQQLLADLLQARLTQRGGAAWSSQN